MPRLIGMLVKKKSFSFLSTGNSMLPLLRTNDLIYYRAIPFRKVRENDILLVQKGKKLFSHRVIYKTGTYLVTKGDNNMLSDGKIRPREIIGKAYAIKRNSRLVELEDIYNFQSLLYLREITENIKSLQNKGVPVLILKGLPLHLVYEGQRPTRIYYDCDILIPQKYKKQAEAVLVKKGYKKMNYDLSTRHNRLKDKDAEDSYIKNVGNFPVVFDTHYEVVFMMTQLGKLHALYPQYLIDKMADEFIAGKQDAVSGSLSLPILNNHHLVLYLMLHFFHHNFIGAFRLSFINHIIGKVRNKDGLFHPLADLILRYRVGGYVYPGFVLLARYYKAPIPQSFLDRIKPTKSRLAYIRKHILTHSIFDEKNRIEGGINRFQNLFYLSPNPVWKRMLVFTYPSVLYSLIWIVLRKVFRKTE